MDLTNISAAAWISWVDNMDILGHSEELPWNPGILRKDLGQLFCIQGTW